MSRPIESTPTLDGADAERLLSDLQHACSPEEAARRIERAKRIRAAFERVNRQGRDVFAALANK